MGDKKSDMDRIGLFQEMAYHTIGDQYKSRGIYCFNEPASKGHQMFPGGTKENSALQHGYFNQTFVRILDGEAYSEPVCRRRRFRIEESKKNIVERPFLPSNQPKRGSGLGSYFGTIGGSYPAFSPIGKELKPNLIMGKNMFTNPGKRGTGYGYANVALSLYPAHSEDPVMRIKEHVQKAEEYHKAMIKGGAFKSASCPQPYFNSNPYRLEGTIPVTKARPPMVFKLEQKTFRPSNPGKKLGGCKMGTFDPYPAHSTDVYTDKIHRLVNVVNNTGKTYVPQPWGKSRPVNSIAEQNVLRCINVNNYEAMAVECQQ